MFPPVILTFGAWTDSALLIHTARDLKAEITSLSEDDGPPTSIMQMIDTLIEQEGKTPMSVVDFKVPPCTFVEYHKARGLPANFIALGDSFVELNPAFGYVHLYHLLWSSFSSLISYSQGCTTAAIAATTLDACLRHIPASEDARVPTSFSAVYSKSVAARLEPTW